MKKLNKLTRCIEYLCAFLIVLITVTTFIQVVRRYVFGSVFFWAEEIAIYSMVWVTFLGAALCLNYKEHTKIDFFLNLLPFRVRRFIEAFDYLACLVFMCVLGYHSLELLRVTGRYVSTGAKIPMYFLYSCVLVSGILMIPYFVLLTVEKLRETNTPKNTPEGEGES